MEYIRATWRFSGDAGTAWLLPRRKRLTHEGRHRRVNSETREREGERRADLPPLSQIFSFPPPSVLGLVRIFVDAARMVDTHAGARGAHCCEKSQATATVASTAGFTLVMNRSARHGKTTSRTSRTTTTTTTAMKGTHIQHTYTRARTRRGGSVARCSHVRVTRVSRRGASRFGG